MLRRFGRLGSAAAHGLIRRIEPALTQSPYGMKPNWSEADLGYDPRLGPR
jgi:hypothetical protein